MSDTHRKGGALGHCPTFFIYYGLPHLFGEQKGGAPQFILFSEILFFKVYSAMIGRLLEASVVPSGVRLTILNLKFRPAPVRGALL